MTLLHEARMQLRCDGTYTSGETDNLLDADVSKSGSDNIRRETED
jgi:hypothetical protein